MENGERGIDDKGMKSCLHMVKQWEKMGRWGSLESGNNGMGVWVWGVII